MIQGKGNDYRYASKVDLVEDLILIEKLIGRADFVVRNGLSLCKQGQTEAQYHPEQRWTIFQYISPESSIVADLASARLCELREEGADLEKALRDLVPETYRTDRIPDRSSEVPNHA